MFGSVDDLRHDLMAFAAPSGADEWCSVPTTISTEVGLAILRLATGKPVALPGAAELDIEESERLGELSRKVIAQVFLSPEATHFTTLGLGPDADASSVRDHFRRLMTIVHPDARPVGFPSDSAVRVNRAYSVLSNDDEKAAYIASLATRDAPALRSGSRASPHRSRTTGERSSSNWMTAVLGVLRSRHALPWLAAALLVPVVALLISTLRSPEPVHLVEAKVGSRGNAMRSPRPEAPPPLPAASETQSNVPAGAPSPTPPPTANASNQPHEDFAIAANTPPNPVRRTEHRANGMMLSDGLSERSLALVTAKRNVAAAPSGATPAPVSRRTEPPSLAPVPSPREALLKAAEGREAIELASPPPPSPISIPIASRSVAAEAEPSAVAAPAKASNTAAPLAAGAPKSETNALRPSDADDLLLKFAAAYESGSISGFAPLFASNMNGRRQLLNEYERVFASTRSRSIRLNQFKHSINGERVATAGYATVTTVDQENRSSSQRVFLEFDITRERGVPRIERLANYTVN